MGSGISKRVSAAFVQYTRDISRSTWLRAGTVCDLIYGHTRMLTHTLKQAVCVHVTRNGVSIRWHRDKTVTVLLPLQGHKTSYDTDRNSPSLVMTGERERERERSERRRETQSRAPKGLRETRESHMIVCVTDRCNLASTNKCTFVKKTEEKKPASGASSWSLMSSLRFSTVFVATWNGKRLMAESAICWWLLGNSWPNDTCYVSSAPRASFVFPRREDSTHEVRRRN